MSGMAPSVARSEGGCWEWTDVMGTMDEERVRARRERRDAEAVDGGQSIAVRSVTMCSEVSWVMVGPRYCTPGTRRRDKKEEEDRLDYSSLGRH